MASTVSFLQEWITKESHKYDNSLITSADSVLLSITKSIVGMISEVSSRMAANAAQTDALVTTASARDFIAECKNELAAIQTLSAQTYQSSLSQIVQSVNATIGAALSNRQQLFDNINTHLTSIHAGQQQLLAGSAAPTTRGKKGENEIAAALIDMFPEAEILQVGSESGGHQGDIHLIRPSKKPILIEVKNYKANVGKTQVEKFISDVLESKTMNGIFISQHSGIVGIADFTYQTCDDGRQSMVYLTSVSECMSKIIAAVKLLDSLDRIYLSTCKTPPPPTATIDEASEKDKKTPEIKTYMVTQAELQSIAATIKSFETVKNQLIADSEAFLKRQKATLQQLSFGTVTELVFSRLDVSHSMTASSPLSSSSSSSTVAMKQIAVADDNDGDPRGGMNSAMMLACIKRKKR